MRAKKTRYIFGSNDSKGNNNKVFTFDNQKCIGLYKYVNINVWECKYKCIGLYKYVNINVSDCTNM